MKKNLGIAAGYALVLIFGMIVGPKFARENFNSKNGAFFPFGIGSRSPKVDKILQIINDNYVDSIKIDTVQELAIKEILKQLDPHSMYLPPVEAQLLSEDLEGNFDGIGIEYYILNDTLLITAVNPQGPAEKSGLLPGDQILKINNKSIADVKLTGKQVVEQVRGKKGTSIELLIKRNDAQLKTLTVIRDKITVSTIDAAYLLNDQTGYIKLNRFGAHTDEDFLAALTKLQKSGMKNLVLDLRENGGGYLFAATAIADQLLGDKKLIVYTEGVHEPRTDYYATAVGKFEQGKLVVLIDENSASASEILAGAIQDLDRGTIIGRRSFGKGLVQEQFNFGDGSALNLTIARYYTPSGRSIQKSYKNGSQAYYGEVGERYKNGELASDGKKLSDTLYNKEKTYTTKSGKVLYGGGGIMPDIYIPVDTNEYTSFYRLISSKGVLNDFAFHYLVKNVSRFANEDNLIHDFQLSNKEYEQIISMAELKGIKLRTQQFIQSKKEIETNLKALLGRYFFGQEGYYKVLNSGDRAIARSLEVLK